MWAQNRGLLGEQVSLGGARARGFALAAAGDPEVWTKLTAEQQKWVVDTLVKLNDQIVKTTGSTCPTWAPSIDRASGCFQPWYNGMYVGSPGFVKLRTDGVFDADTLQALITTALIHQADFPASFPGQLPTAAKKGLSTGAMVGIGAGVAAAGGLLYAATRGGSKSRRRR